MSSSTSSASCGRCKGLTSAMRCVLGGELDTDSATGMNCNRGVFKRMCPATIKRTYTTSGTHAGVCAHCRATIQRIFATSAAHAGDCVQVDVSIGGLRRALPIVGSWATVVLLTFIDTYLVFIVGTTILGFAELRKVRSMNVQLPRNAHHLKIPLRLQIQRNILTHLNRIPTPHLWPHNRTGRAA